MSSNCTFIYILSVYVHFWRHFIHIVQSINTSVDNAIALPRLNDL